MEIAGLTLHSVIKAKGDNLQPQQDILAVEEPLQIQLQLNTSTGRIHKNIAITMRTPGNDDELAAGFLFTEGIINNRQQIAGICHVHNDENNVLVALKDDAVPVLQNSERNFYTTSSCGVCGKASIDAIKTASAFNDAVHFTVAVDILYALQSELIKQQKLFESTGGLHAAALFDLHGNFELLKEDIGRHNALDKLIGHFFLQEGLPLCNKILLLSGRTGFELIQKAVMAGIKMIAAIGAPSSMAVELAVENDVTLVGFLRHNSMNIYCGNQRIK